MASPTLKLNNGRDIPVVGLGTYLSEPGVVAQAVKDAIDAGYRHIDCAYFYGNEKEIGEAIKEKVDDGTVKREDLFVTSKLWNNSHKKDLVLPACTESVSALGFGYVDLYLMHWPMADDDTDYVETWKALEECVDLGLAKNIGLSNFNSEQIDRVLSNARIKPVVNQVECNPNINQKKLIEFCRKRDIIVTGYCPLGGPAEYLGKAGRPQPSILDPKIIEIGKKYNKSAAQVVLKYLVNLGISVVPKSVKKERIISNIQLFDFELSPEDTAYIDSLNRNVRSVAMEAYRSDKYFPFALEF